ncbi:MAG: MFS transporter [Arenimonas sp.]
MNSTNDTGRAALPRSVWALGLVSLFMDMSSEMIHGLLPVFLVGTLGVSAFALGLIEGAAEATASIAKIFSGVMSDHWGKRKPLIALGYGMAALTKPLFPLANSALTVFMARFIDRIGKGVRGAPRDALVADVTAPEQRGAAYGLRQSMDTVGAFAGPLIAIALMVGFAFDIRQVFWIACIPALIAVLVLLVGVQEPAVLVRPLSRGNPFSGFRARDYPATFWALVVLVLMFTLMRFSEAFLVLRARDAGLSGNWIPLTLVVMSGTYLLTAYPAGKLSDRVSRHLLLAIGCLVMLVADLLLAFAPSLPWVIAGIALWGVHMGLTEGLIAALTADYAPPHLRGTAFGVVNLARGVMLLIASALAGGLWTLYGAPATFLTGAVLAVLTAVMALAMRTRAQVHVVAPRSPDSPR